MITNEKQLVVSHWQSKIWSIFFHVNWSILGYFFFNTLAATWHTGGQVAFLTRSRMTHRWVKYRFSLNFFCTIALLAMVLVLQYLAPRLCKISAHTLWSKNLNFLMKENAVEQRCCTTLQTSTISHDIVCRGAHILAKSHCYSRSLQLSDA